MYKGKLYSDFMGGGAAGEGAVPEGEAEAKPEGRREQECRQLGANASSLGTSPCGPMVPVAKSGKSKRKFLLSHLLLGRSPRASPEAVKKMVLKATGRTQGQV